MAPGPFAFLAKRGRGVSTATCAGIVLAGLLVAAPAAPAPTLELPTPGMVLWFPVISTPLLWPPWLRR